MDYKQMIVDARKKGLTNEDKMWASIASMNTGLQLIEKEHPDLYWKMMREQHEILYGPHYSEDFANWDVEQFQYTDKDGQKHSGAHWTKEQVNSATNSWTFPPRTTECDKYVAFNSMYADLSKEFDDATILKVAYRFYFQDEDAPEGKIWHYIKAMHN